MRVYGARNFPASVLSAVGVDRPAAQRFTDKAYLEIGTTDADLARGRTSPLPTPTSSTSRVRRRRPPNARGPSSTVTPGASCPPIATTGSSSSTTRYGRRARAWWQPVASSTTCAGSTPRSTEASHPLDVIAVTWPENLNLAKLFTAPARPLKDVV
ncbi:FEIII-dicitrate-binding periplasmic lipoFecB domain protein [Mycobacterium kansasii]|uniref:FEIII-dicitrate-binding periplasmic lipoFecB domain protein n=1 Tax=Mycobacterium kansasii TaxID=1768 RepID=A0A1V3XRA1_MYCKA|nr:FEIII-dicitrate-binding periplasmic lipoFecB domain protein [Mycobacterium kansasii]